MANGKANWVIFLGESHVLMFIMTYEEVIELSLSLFWHKSTRTLYCSVCTYLLVFIFAASYASSCHGTELYYGT
jgi:hypothetical protein